MSTNRQFKQIRELLAKQQFAEPLEILAELQQDYLHEPEYWWLVAVCHGEQGNHDGAISALESATTYCPLDVESQVLLGRLYADKGYKESATAIFEHLARMPAALELHRAEIIRQLGRLQRYELAVDLCQQATEESPDDWQAWFAKAFYLGRIGAPSMALVAALERARDLRPDQVTVRVSLVKTLAALGLEKAMQQAAREISIEQIHEIGCRDCVCHLARAYQAADDRPRWQACIQRYATLRRRKKQ